LPPLGGSHLTSGLFDRFPDLTIILGHLGEGLPFLLPRVEHRLRHARQELRGRQTRPVMSYLRDNFFITTAGAFRTAALLDTLLEVGADRVLFSVDYPYEKGRYTQALCWRGRTMSN